MNHCHLGGYLVDGKWPLPTDPSDHDVELLASLGCNRVRCRSCKAMVRNLLSFTFRDLLAKVSFAELYDTEDLASSPLLQPMSGFRLYLCRCQRWVQKSREDALGDPDPDPNGPRLPWRCDGHPLVDLPREMDGVSFTADNLTDLVRQSLHGWTPPAAHPEHRERYPVRLYLRMAQTPWADAVVRAALAGLEDADAAARGRALRFFFTVGAPGGPQRAVELLDGDRRLFAGVPYEKGGTLEDALRRLAAPLLKA